MVSLAYHMIGILKSIRLNRATNRQRVRRLPDGVRFIAEKSQQMQHDSVWHKIIRFCSVCLVRTLLRATTARKKCSAPTLPFKGLLKHPKGHCLSSAGLQGEGSLLTALNVISVQALMLGHLINSVKGTLQSQVLVRSFAHPGCSIQ